MLLNTSVALWIVVITALAFEGPPEEVSYVVI